MIPVRDMEPVDDGDRCCTVCTGNLETTHVECDDSVNTAEPICQGCCVEGEAPCEDCAYSVGRRLSGPVGCAA